MSALCACVCVCVCLYVRMVSCVFVCLFSVCWCMLQMVVRVYMVHAFDQVLRDVAES